MIPSSPRRFAPILLAGLVVIALIGCGEAPRHRAVGTKLASIPVASIANLSAGPVNLTGRVTLLNFWGTWCGPCRRELPGLARMATSLESERRFQLVAVSVSGGGGERAEDLAAETGEFLLSHNLPISAYVFTDPLAADMLSTTLGLQAVPATYLIGPDATIRRVWIGYRPQDEADMAAAIVALLKESPAQPE
jgi:thiol-disulfide isomerase/thioredoxin